MRLTRDTLIKIARDAAAQRAKISRRIICIYLTGSVLEENPLLGGTTDIDLIIIQDSEPIQPREVVRLSDDVHLDIAFYDQAIFRHPRHLRTDPWLGPFIYRKPMVLHDTQHWFDFIQAATGAQFQQPEYAIQRALKLAQSARQRWMDLEMNPDPSHARQVENYLQAMQDAANALASLSGEPTAERRFLVQLPHKLHSLNNPSLVSGLVHLLAPETIEWEPGWQTWLQSWKEAYKAAGTSPDAPIHLHPSRFFYFEKAIHALWEENTAAALWLLARTWAPAVSTASPEAAFLSEWQSALQTLKLDEDNFSSRLHQMDTYLDLVEETLEAWANSNGVSGVSEI